LKVTLGVLQQMKRDGRKIVGVVAYDYQIAQIVDRAGVDLISAGDSVGVTVWGHRSQLEVTVDQMVLVCQAVRRGVAHALVSCDVPFGPLQLGSAAAVAAARRLIEEGGADLVKLDDAASFPEAVRAVTQAGIPVWAQFGITPHTSTRDRTASRDPDPAAARRDEFVSEARRLEEAGASLLDFTYSGPVAGPAVVHAVQIPVIGGLGGGPWLDGRIRSVYAAIGYQASALDDDTTERYANVAAMVLESIVTLSDDVRSGRQIRGESRS